MVSKSETTPPEKKPVSCEDHQRERWRRQRKNVCKRKGKVVPFRRAATTARYSWMPQRASHNSLRKLLLSFAVGFVLPYSGIGVPIHIYRYANTYSYTSDMHVCTCSYTYHRGPDSWYTHAHIHIHTQIHTHIARRGIIASEHARSNFRSAFLSLSSLSLPLFAPSSPGPLPSCPSYLHVLTPWMHPPVCTFIPIGCICT